MARVGPQRHKKQNKTLLKDSIPHHIHVNEIEELISTVLQIEFMFIIPLATKICYAVWTGNTMIHFQIIVQLF